MNRQHTAGALFLVLVAAAGCDPAGAEPVFCVSSAGSDSSAAIRTAVETMLAGRKEDDLAVLRSVCDREKTPTIDERSAIVLTHVLDSRVKTESKVVFTLETPCDVPLTVERTHVEGVVETTVQAPLGSSCALTVTAAIQNSVLRREADSGECNDIATTCASADAGAPEERDQ